MQESKIQILSDNLINKIAAGEVVERPASAVKELVENAIDAGADQISVRLENGGINLIEIADNGSGMSKLDLEFAFKQHATSKIHTEADLETILSMGFRGEALPSIASVAEVYVVSNDGASTQRAQVKNGQVEVASSDARSRGTTIQVQSIFSKVPARRKFLRSEASEYKHILDTLSELALAHYQISFRLTRDNKEVFHLSVSPTPAERILDLYGKLHVDDLITLKFENSDMNISGFVGHPRVARGDKSQQFVFLNGRTIHDKLIARAVSNACARHLMVGRQPVYFLYLDINPLLVDVNVHPRKLEVRFVEPSTIFKYIYNCVATTLQTHLQANIKQQFSAHEPNNSDIPSSPGWQELNHAHTPHANNQSDAWKEAPAIFSQSLPESANFENRAQIALEGLQVLQVLSTYLLVEISGKLLIIDQHAAAEKIKYEQLENEYAKQGAVASQPLLISKVLELTLAEQETIRQYQSVLAKLGFHLEDFSGHTYKLNEIPALLATSNYEETLSEVLQELDQSGGGGAQIALDKARKNIFATLACHGSIRAGQKLHTAEVSQLIKQLLDCKEPYSCPHGRPTIWELNQNELEKKFKRKV